MKRLSEKSSALKRFKTVISQCSGDIFLNTKRKSDLLVAIAINKFSPLVEKTVLWCFKESIHQTHILVLSIAVLLVSCEEEEFGSDSFVVEGFVYAGLPIGNINIKSTVPFDEVSIPGQPIPTAQAQVNYNGQSLPLTFNPMTFRFDGPQDLIVEPGAQLTLALEVDGQSAISSTAIPPYPRELTTSAPKIVIPEIELGRDLREVLTQLFEDARLDIQWDNPAEDFHFLVIELADTANVEPLFNEDIPSNVGDFFENFRLVSEPSRDSTYTVIGLSLQNYGSYRAILYRINQEYADLYADQLQDSRNLNEPPTNVQNGLGIFTGISSDTVLFEISKF